MASKRATIYIPAEAKVAIGPAENLSSRLMCIADRHRQFVADNMPSLKLSEWCAIMDANNGVDAFVPLVASMVWRNLQDSLDLGEKWGIDIRLLVHRMRGMSVSELLAISDVCHRFWSDDTGGHYREILKRCGGKITPDPVD